MHDILPADQPYWERINQVIKNLARAYGFERLDTPILEETDLFVKGTGADTDIIEKEMYTLRTKGGDQLTLRPEFTPAIMRAYLETVSRACLTRLEFTVLGRFSVTKDRKKAVIGNPIRPTSKLSAKKKRSLTLN